MALEDLVGPVEVYGSPNANKRLRNFIIIARF